MKKKFIFCFILFVFLMVSISFIESSAKNLHSRNSSSKVLENLTNDSEIRIMIKLSSGNLDKKQEIAAKIGKKKMRNDFGNSFSVSINSSDLEVIKNMKGVESVSNIGTREIFLQDSVLIVNGTLASGLTVNGVNLTGVGQTVCIIDTGVNYSHRDLGSCYGNNNVSSSCKVIGGWDYYNSDSDPYDDHGHGTHVAGIVAANGSIRGVAPGAKIMAIKACNAAGSCSDDAINAGINFCVSNSSIFNISVISMSLGAGAYDNYCNDDFLAPAIDSAVAKNISVVIASGNDYDFTQISSPACVQSAIPVSATRKNDTIADYANTNWMVQLLAPGGDSSSVPSREINSTWKNGAYHQISGTSMATPHVAGAIAIINQYLLATSQTRTPAQIETILNATGKPIVDANYSNLTFYRINIYAALLSFNMTLTLQSPANNTAVNNNFSNFSCYSTASLNSILSNVTFYLWNSSSSLIYNLTKNITGSTNNTFFNYNFSLEDNYRWNCLAKSNISSFIMGDSNFSLIYDVTKPVISLISPSDSDSKSSGSITFSFNITEINSISNCSLIINDVLNQTAFSITNLSASQSITKTLAAGSYNWSINCVDFAGNIGNSSSRNLTITQTTISSGDSSVVGGGNSGGGGGGGGGNVAQTYIPTRYQVVQGYTKELGKEDKVKFSTLAGENHSARVNRIDSAAADLTISSTPFNVTLYVGIEKKINISSASFYDLSLKLNSVISDKANITLKVINEEIKKAGVRQISEENVSSGSEEIGEGTKPLDNKVYIWVLVGVIVIIAVVLILRRKSKAISKITGKKK